MRIWIVNQYAVPPAQAGPTRHYSFARELMLRGHEVTVIASSFDHVCRQQAHLSEGERYRYELADGVPFLWFRTPSYRENDLWRAVNMLTFSGWLWPAFPVHLLPRPDVIVGSVPTIFSAFAASMLATQLKVPFVLEVRDLWPQVLIDFMNLSHRHPLVRCLGGMERYLYRHSNGIITLLPGSFDYLSGRGACRTKIRWLPNGIDLSLVPAPGETRARGVFTVMFIGNHGLAYGLDALLDAALLLKEEKPKIPLRFRLIGDGPEKRRLRVRAEQEGIDTVSFEEPVPKRDIYSILQEADAFLMILKDAPVFRRGTSPNKIFDYLASARPIIFSGDDSFDYVVKAKAGLTVPAGDVRRLAQAITELAESPAERLAEMGWCGRRYVEEHFSIARLVVGFEEILFRAVADHLTWE